MRRRDFISGIAGTAAWPLAARAQQPERMRRISVLLPFPSDDPEVQARLGAFLQELRQLGWIIGRNLRVDYRWGGGNADVVRKHATELAALAPHVILAHGASTVGALLQATRTVPIVFAIVSDPVGAGFIASLARPGGNTTGFTLFEYGVASKWLELLKEIAPGIIRVAVLRDPAIAAGIGQLGAIQAVAPSLNVDLTPIDVREAAEIERGLTEFARAPNGGLVVTGSPSQGIHRELIVTLVAKYRLPAIYPFRYMAPEGGLLAYGPDQLDQYRRATVYIDRILKGESPADLPVQAPTKYEMAINLKTAKTLGLTVPPTLLVRADEVIE